MSMAPQVTRTCSDHRSLKRQKRKKNYAQLDQGYKEYSDRNEGDSMNNS